MRPSIRLLTSSSLVLTLTLMGSFIWIPASSARPSSQRVSMRYTPPRPPNRRAPGTNRGAGSRDCLVPDKETKEPTLDSLGALVPQVTRKDGTKQWAEVWGRTTTPQPTLWFYSPYSTASMKKVEFILQDAEDQDIYRTPVSIPATPGLVSVTLPAKIALKPNTMYRWYFNVLGKDCSQQKPSSPSALNEPTLNEPMVQDALTSFRTVNGWIEYTPVAEPLAAQLKQASPQNQATLYAANGFWYDALNAIAILKQTQPTDTAIAADWAGLLKQSGLEKLASQPILKCCTAE
jgi:Domain of Unknown Function (DUF928)